MNTPRDTRFVQWVLFALLTGIWGASFLFIKISLETLPPLTVVALRVTLGALLVWTLVVWRGASLRGVPWGAMLFMGVINNALPFTLITWGEQYIPSGLASLVNGTVPIFAAVLSHSMLRAERLTRLQWGGVMLGFGGLVWLFLPDVWYAWQGLTTWYGVFGQFAVMTAASCYAVGTVYARKHLREYDPFVMAATQLLWSAVVLWPLAWWAGLGLTASALTGRTLLAIGWLGLASSGLAYVIYYTLVRLMGATQVTMVTYLIPVVGLVLGAVFLDETVGWDVLIALALILTSIVVVNRPRVHSPSPAAVRCAGR